LFAVVTSAGQVHAEFWQLLQVEVLFRPLNGDRKDNTENLPEDLVVDCIVTSSSGSSVEVFEPALEWRRLSRVVSCCNSPLSLSCSFESCGFRPNNFLMDSILRRYQQRPDDCPEGLRYLS